MHVSEAARWFANTTLDGLSSDNAWVETISLGDFQTYDRFITERTFGVKKRVFLAPALYRFDIEDYPVVRTPDGLKWIVAAENLDLDVSAYQQTYLLLRAQYVAQIVGLTSATLASGQAGGAAETVVGSYYADVEAYSLDTSDLAKQAVYGVYEITLPHGAVVDEENKIKVDNEYFYIKEIAEEINTVTVKCTKQG